MNIAKEITFNTEKPFVLPIRKTETVHIFAMGLLKEQIFAKHKTQIPALLVVLRGSILFRINSEEIRLTALDTYQIPIDTEHDVTGLDEENIFLITKEKI
jgi:quercetin dioxygenase-like cupin family protein